MKDLFDIDHVRSSEFFVCEDSAEGERYWHIPIDGHVQETLIEMLNSTIEALAANEMERFEFAQKYGQSEWLVAELNDPAFEKLRALFNLPPPLTNPTVLAEPGAMAYYFATFIDNKKRKIVAVRRATQFKGVIKARNRLISWIDDSLQIVKEDIFRLDQDFDYLIFHDQVWILHSTGFEYTASVDDAVTARTLQIVAEVAKSVPCVNFEALTDFVSKHRRAARLIASLRAREDIHLTSPKKLKRGCKSNGIKVVEANGQFTPEPGHEMAFLELLDRRRYVVELIDEEEELYVAPNRRGLPRPPK